MTSPASPVVKETLTKKYIAMSDRQDSIQALSLWMMHHKSQYKKIVDIWFSVVKKDKSPHRLTMMYLCNDVLQNCKRKHATVFKEAFRGVLKDSMLLVRDPAICKKVERLLQIWKDREVFNAEFVNELLASLADEAPVVNTNSAILADFQPKTMIDAINNFKMMEADVQLKQKQVGNLKVNAADLEAVRQLKDKAHGTEFSQQFEESCQKIEDYVKNVEWEVKERTHIIDLLEKGEMFYEAQYGEAKIVTNAYKNYGTRVNNLKKRLKEYTKTLSSPSSPIPSPNIDAPSPGDTPPNQEELDMDICEEETPVTIVATEIGNSRHKKSSLDSRISSLASTYTDPRSTKTHLQTLMMPQTPKNAASKDSGSNEEVKTPKYPIHFLSGIISQTQAVVNTPQASSFLQSLTALTDFVQNKVNEKRKEDVPQNWSAFRAQLESQNNGDKTEVSTQLEQDSEQPHPPVEPFNPAPKVAVPPTPPVSSTSAPFPRPPTGSLAIESMPHAGDMLVNASPGVPDVYAKAPLPPSVVAMSQGGPRVTAVAQYPGTSVSNIQQSTEPGTSNFSSYGPAQSSQESPLPQAITVLGQPTTSSSTNLHVVSRVTHPLPGGPPPMLSGPPPRPSGPPPRPSGQPPRLNVPPTRPSGKPPRLSGPPPRLSTPPIRPSTQPPRLTGPPPRLSGQTPRLSGPLPRPSGQPQLEIPRQPLNMPNNPNLISPVIEPNMSKFQNHGLRGPMPPAQGDNNHFPGQPGQSLDRGPPHNQQTHIGGPQSHPSLGHGPQSDQPTGGTPQSHQTQGPPIGHQPAISVPQSQSHGPPVHGSQHSHLSPTGGPQRHVHPHYGAHGSGFHHDPMHDSPHQQPPFQGHVHQPAPVPRPRGPMHHEIRGPRPAGPNIQGPRPRPRPPIQNPAFHGPRGSNTLRPQDLGSLNPEQANNPSVDDSQGYKGLGMSEKQATIGDVSSHEMPPVSGASSRQNVATQDEQDVSPAEQPKSLLKNENEKDNSVVKVTSSGNKATTTPSVTSTLNNRPTADSSNNATELNTSTQLKQEPEVKTMKSIVRPKTSLSPAVVGMKIQSISRDPPPPRRIGSVASVVRRPYRSDNDNYDNREEDWNWEETQYGYHDYRERYGNNDRQHDRHYDGQYDQGYQHGSQQRRSYYQN